jgi:hypothetical protein
VKPSVQDINLLASLPRAKKVLPTLHHVLITWLLVFALGLFAAVLQGAKTKKMTYHLGIAKASLKQEAKAFMHRHSHHKGQHLVAVLDGYYKPFLPGFYPVLHQLTVKPVQQLWLARMLFHRKDNMIELHGYASRAHAVYELIDSLQSLAGYQGQVFNLLSLVKETVSDVRTRKARGTRRAKRAPRREEVRYTAGMLQFVLSTEQAQPVRSTRRGKKKGARHRRAPKKFDPRRQQLAMNRSPGFGM